ncbi:hypothetical protein D9M71_335130 [compost metagenome]
MQGPAFVGQGANVDGVEAGRPRGDGSEQCREQLVVQGHGAQGAWIAPLEPQQAQESAEQQGRCAAQGQLGMQGPVPRVGELAAKVIQHGKTDAANDDGGHHGSEDHAVVGIAHEAVGVDGKAGVVERRHGMEQAAPGCCGPVQVISQMQPRG